MLPDRSVRVKRDASVPFTLHASQRLGRAKPSRLTRTSPARVVSGLVKIVLRGAAGTVNPNCRPLRCQPSLPGNFTTS